MKVPYSWLREYCDPGIRAPELLDLLALRTTDTEGVAYVGPPAADGFVVGKVVAAEKHPDADRLSVCEVDTGDTTRTIVCGAPNVAAGQTVAVALPGATMPGGEELGKAKLRGVVSDGMILSEAELGIGDDAGGIVALDDGPRPGAPLADLLPIAEPVLELEVHSNRVDCFGVYGVAREAHAITAAPLATPPWHADAQPSGNDEVSDYASVSVEVPELCPRFTARVFEDVTIGPSPLWLKGRLIAAGQRPINNVVDITNYVMLLTAQPLHAFDLDEVPGGKLIVRTAAEGEKMTTLDGVERRFETDAVLVCDNDGPTGVAGIMGGQVSEVSDSTTRVLLEVATWNGRNILRTSRNLGLRSEASNRFEKQLHPEIAMRAQRVASRLLVDLCGARLVPGTIDEAAEVPEARRIGLRVERVEGLLGMRVGPGECSEYLGRLGFRVEGKGDELEAEVPFERHYDVIREVDLIEEVGRIHGYDEHLPSTLPKAVGQGGRLSREQVLRRRAEDVMRELGFDAVINLSLTDPGMPGRMRLANGDPRGAPIVVSNPLSLDHSRLRTTLLGSLLDAARYNLAHGAERIALYESGRAYLKERPASDPCTPGREAEDVPGIDGPGREAEDVPGIDGPGRAAEEAAGIGAEDAAGMGELAGNFAGRRPAPAHEPQRICALAVGAMAPPSWRADPGPADFFALKGALEALAAQLGAELRVEEETEPFLHPGRAARVLLGGAEAGWLGELHPLVCRAWDLEAAAGFEIGLGELAEAASLGSEQYEDVTSYPAVQQDLAVIVDEDVPAARVRGAVLDGGGELLRSARVFDLYRGDQVGEGRKSLALRLTFRAPDRTLTDEEVAELRERIRVGLAELGGSLRE